MYPLPSLAHPSIPTQFVCSHPIPLNVPICCHSNATLQTRNVCTPSLTATSIGTHPIPSVVTRTNQCPHSLPRNHHTVHQYTMYVPPSLTAAQLYRQTYLLPHHIHHDYCTWSYLNY